MGETVSRFYQQVQDASTWTIYSFEPHPESYQTLVQNCAGHSNIKCVEAAVTGNSKKIRSLYCGKTNNGEGSTMVVGKRTGRIDTEHPRQVKAISLADFVNRNLKADDHIVLKLNIEGGEYEVMQHILNERLMGRFAQFFIQLHTDKLPAKDADKYVQLEHRFARQTYRTGADLFYATDVFNNFQPINHNQPDSKGKRMKVAHFAEFAPHRTGLYATARDLIMAERSIGIDAALVDIRIIAGRIQKERKNLADGDLKIETWDWAKEADLLVHHTNIPDPIKSMGIPIVLAIHGRPESTFLLEHRRITSVYGLTTEHGRDPRYRAFITFWQEYMFHLGLQVPKDKLFCIPAPVDLTHYIPKGEKHTFEGSPSILIVDMWRHDVTPFNIIMAATRFAQDYAPEAKIHILGAQKNKRSMKSLMNVLKKAGVLGQVFPLVENTEICYRGADMVVTPHNIATRVVREALACATPVVAGLGNPYTRYTADYRQADKFATAINTCWQDIQTKTEVTRAEARSTAEKSFSREAAGNAAKKIFEKVLAEDEEKWTPQGQFFRKKYFNYNYYLAEQKGKLPCIPKKSLANYDKEYYAELFARLSKLPYEWVGRNALCLGARQGTEVRAFIALGCFAVGVDLNPGPENKYVVTGDFHKLQFAQGSVDYLFTNSLDHVYRINKFLGQAKRLLKPDGRFIVDAHKLRDRKQLAKGGQIGSDRWASLWWEKHSDWIDFFIKCGFELVKNVKVTDSKHYVERQLCFRKKEVA